MRQVGYGFSLEGASAASRFGSEYSNQATRRLFRCRAKPFPGGLRLRSRCLFSIIPGTGDRLVFGCLATWLAK